MIKRLLLSIVALCVVVAPGKLLATEIEPNNIAAQAGALIPGVTENGAHDASDSTDWWKVTTVADGKLTIRISAPASGECTSLQLFEQNGTTLLKNNGSCGYSNYASEISYNNLMPATYYIMATRGQLPGGAYTIIAEFVPESLSVDTGLNGVRDSAQILTLNGSVTGHLGYYNGAITRDSIDWNNGKRDNIDYWKVTTNADGRLLLRVKSTGALCVQLRIRTSVDTVGFLDNNGSCGYSNLRNYLEVKNLAPGTYFVEAWDANWKYNTNYGAYSLACSLYTETTPNDTGANDYASLAKTLSINDSVKGHLGFLYGDVADTIAWINGKRDNIDWWKIVVPVDGRLVVRVKSSATLCVQLKLHTKADSVGTIDANGSCGYSNYRDNVQVNNLAPGTYYVEVFDVNWKNNTNYGGYTIACSLYTDTTINDTGSNDYASLAKPLAVNNSVTGHLGYYYGDVADTIAWINGKRDNVDWWKIVTQADGRLMVRLKSSSTLCVQLKLHTKADSVGTIDANGSCGYSNYRDYVQVNNLAPGTYYVEVFDVNWKNNTNYGGYSLACSLYTVTALNDSGPNDYASQAKSLAINDSTTGHLGYYYGDVADTIAWINGKRDNVDWWKMVLTQRGKISVSVASDPTLCVQMGLRSSADTVTNLIANGSCGYSNYGSTINYFITPGTYYLVAWDPSWNYNTKYGAYGLKTIYTPAPAASFDVVGEGNAYSFINSTSGASSYSWSFGDNTSSTQENPRHTYANPGVFTVTLIAANDAGADTVSRLLTLKGLHKVESSRAGNTGDATVYIYGGGFKAASSVYLVKSGQTDLAATPIDLPRPGMLRAQFDLRGAPVGVYSVRVTTPGDSAMTLANAFTVETGRTAEPGVAVIGRDRILFNRWQTYTISYWNSSNIDAHGVPLWIAMSDLPDSQVQIIDFKVVPPKMAADSGFSFIKDSLPVFYRTDTLFGTPFNARVYPLYIPVIPAGQTENIHIRVKTAGDITMYAWINDPYYQSPLKGTVADCIWWAQAKAFRDGVIDMAPIPGLGCVTSIATKVYDPFDYPMPKQTTDEGWMSYLGSKIWSLGTITLNCAADIIPAGKLAKTTIAIIETATKAGSIVTNSIDNYGAKKACEEAYGDKSMSQRGIKAVSSFDPNEKIGPSGFKAEKYIARGGTYGYSVFFENKASATAPAQEVSVVDTLDTTKLDLTTFAFGAAGFGATRTTPPANSRKFSADFDLRPGKSIIVRVTGVLDTVAGVARWLFTSLDPATMSLTEDPMGGFLPPNTVSPEGEGVVSYSVRPKATIKNGDRIAGRASIVFDLNAPILTNVYSNTIDTVAPASSITALTPLNDSTFTISWGGNDNGSGIREYSVYVALPDSDYVPLLVNSPLTSATFVCKRGCRLYSIATDSAGNIEEAPSTPDVSGVLLTATSRPLYFALLGTSIDRRSRQPVIRFSVPQAVHSTIMLYSTQGRMVAMLDQQMTVPGIYAVKMPVNGGIAAGTYIVSIICKASTGKVVFNEKSRVVMMR